MSRIVFTVEKIEAEIKIIESRLNSIRLALAHNEFEIQTLMNTEHLLKDNIFELKRQGVAILASEYKKAKEELVKVTTRLAFLRIDQNTYERALNSQIGVLDYLKMKLDEIVRRQQNNVIQAKFGKKDDK